MAETKTGSNLKARLFIFLFENKWKVVAAFFLAAVMSALFGSGIRLKDDLMELLPAGDPVVRRYRTMLDAFRGLDYVLIDVGPGEGLATPSQDELASVADALVGRMGSGKARFDEIYYRWDAGDVSAAMDTLREHRASLFTDRDRAKLDERLTARGIRETLAGWKKLLIEFPAPFLSQSFLRDPLAIDLTFMDRLKSFNVTDGRVRMSNGRIFSQDMNHVLVIAMPKAHNNSGEEAKELVGFMDKAAREAEAAAPGRVHIAYMASHRFAVDNSEMIKADVKRTMTISLAAILVLSALVYRRTLLMTALTLVPAFFGGVFASGMVRFFYPDISAISVGCGSLLVGVVVDFGIYFLYQTDQLPGDETGRESLIGILDRISVPVLMCAGTTILAFLALQFSAIPGVRQIGLFAAFGVAGAAAFTLLALPLLVPKSARFSRKAPVVSLADLYPPYFRWVERRRAALLVVVGAITVASFFGLLRLGFEGDVQKLNAASRETVRDKDIIAGSFGEVMNSTSVAIVAPTLDAALARNDRLYPELLRLQGDGLIKANNSIAVILPGEAAQRENRSRWQAFWAGGHIEALLRDVERACLELRINPGPVASALKGLPGEGAGFGIDAIKGSFLHGIISHHIAVNAGRTFVLTNLSLNDIDDYPRVSMALEKADPELIVTNGRFFVRHTVQLIYRELLMLGGIALLFIAALLAVYARRLRDFIVLLAPVLLSLLWTLGLMGWLGIRINMLNSIVVILIFGLGIDYIIFIDSTWKASGATQDGHLSRTSGAVTVSATSTLLGMGALLFARHPALHAIGASTVIAIGIGIVAALLVVPLIDKRGANRAIEGSKG